jgi:hypothetical protein
MKLEIDERAVARRIGAQRNEYRRADRAYAIVQNRPELARYRTRYEVPYGSADPYVRRDVFASRERFGKCAIHVDEPIVGVDGVDRAKISS